MKRVRRKPGLGVLLTSGGIDSTVLAYYLKKQKNLDAMMVVNYGQKSFRSQLRCTQYHAKILNAPLIQVNIKLPKFMQGSGAIMHGTPAMKQRSAYEAADMSDARLKVWMDNVYDSIPCRNTMFLLYALGYARETNVDTVYVGFQLDKPEWEQMRREKTNSSSVFDTTPGFVEHVNLLIDNGGIDRDITVSSPWLDGKLDKSVIVEIGRELDVNMEKTYSCEFSPPCGGCRGCLVRTKVLTSEVRGVR